MSPSVFWRRRPAPVSEGEERLALSLPRGYGYANKATDRWGLLYMLMNHKPQRLNGFIRYTVRYVTGEALTPVKPIWLDVRAGAHHHIADNNFYRVAPHRFKAREPDRPARRSAQWRTHPRGYRLATPRKKL